MLKGRGPTKAFKKEAFFPRWPNRNLLKHASECRDPHEVGTHHTAPNPMAAKRSRELNLQNKPQRGHVRISYRFFPASGDEAKTRCRCYLRWGVSQFAGSRLCYLGI
jgi:hypothetical protein